MAMVLKNARMLANYISTLDYHSFNYTPGASYGHIGALFTDIILQSGLNYSSVVRPRVGRILQLFPEAKTRSSFEEVIQKHGINFVINWNNHIKIIRLQSLLTLVRDCNIESESDFSQFLCKDENKEKVLAVNGIGPKTVDYALKLMCVDCIAVDRHVYHFIQKAGLSCNDYYEVKKIVEFAADLLDTPRSKLDTFIWTHMSSGKYLQTTIQF
jgi:hypothetical protein